MASIQMNSTGLNIPNHSDRNRPSQDNSQENGLFGLLKNMQPQTTTKAEGGLEYLFEDEYVANGPSWGARICYGTGVTYLIGLGAGGSWGLTDGFRNPAGRTSTRLRINCILNSMTARGPFVANNLAMLALLYNLVHGAVIKARNGQYDLGTSVGSATAAGLIYKCTAGIKPMSIAGLVYGGGMLVYQLSIKYHENGSIPFLRK